jgi:serine/threonine protein kinase
MPKIEVNGRAISLTQNDFLAQGGEGAIYVKGDTAYKLYLDPSRMIPTGKIRELSVLSSPAIIKPDIVIYENGRECGYTMQYVKDTYPLCQLFTKAFRDRVGLTSDMVIALVRDFQKTITHIHEKKVLVVDLNEMNFLADHNFKTIYAIDVDSYQTPSYPATAIMESIRDRHNKKFDEGTDWFAFAIVSFQMFIGIHPYKGKHPTLKDFDSRMLANVSVFNPSVSVPKVTLPFDVIPPIYQQWYKAVFEKGIRVPPPESLVAVINTIAATHATVISQVFTIIPVAEYDQEIREYWVNNSASLAIGKDEIYVETNGFKRSIKVNLTSCKFAGGFYGSCPLLLIQESGKNATIYNHHSGEVLETILKIDQSMSYKGRIYTTVGEYVYEMKYENPGSRGLVVPQVVANVLPHASKMFPGVIVQDLLGTCYVSVFPQSGECYQIRINEIKGYKLVDAKFDNGILMFVGNKKGIYDRFVFSIKDDQILETRKIENVSYNSLNFITLNSGICVGINEDDKIELFYSNAINKVKLIEDSRINGQHMVRTDGDRVLFIEGNKIIQGKTKEKKT